MSTKNGVALLLSRLNNARRTTYIAVAAVICIACLVGAGASTRSADAPSGTVFVHTALGGFILGYDIDQNGTEGLLAESVPLADGYDTAAIETFDQKTGKILDIVNQQNDTKSDFVALGIFGTSTGLAEFEHVTTLYVDKRLYGTLNPLSLNQINGRWTPPLNKNDIILSLGKSQGAANTAVMAFANTADTKTFVFSSNVAANTFGPRITVKDSLFDFNYSPVMDVDTATNVAVLGASNGAPFSGSEIGLVNLTTGAQTEFAGLGDGFINGIAVDSANGIACVTSEIDFSIEVYNLATHQGIIRTLQNATNQLYSGGAVAFDPIHKLFLVGQEFSSISPSGSSIQVFDEQGDFIEGVNGLSLPASPAYMALNPAKRAGYVIVTPALTELQSFTY